MGSSGGHPKTLHGRVAELHAEHGTALLDNGPRCEAVVGTGQRQVCLVDVPISSPRVQHCEIRVSLKTRSQILLLQLLYLQV